jgi:hypothetical protein
LQAISGRWDAATVVRILESADDTVRSNVLHAEIATSGWYPVTWYADLYRACRTVTGAPVEIAAELRAEALRHDARGLFRFLLKFTSPGALVSNYERVCGLYLDGPRIEVQRVGLGAIDVRWSNLVGYDEACVHDHLGGALEAITLCQGRAARLTDLEIVRTPTGSSPPGRDESFAQYEAFRSIIHWD